MTKYRNLDWSGSFADVSMSIRAVFGPAKKAPGKKRLVKDVLRVGTWHMGGQQWNVRPETLATMAANFVKRRELGNAVNIVKTHGDQETGVVHPDDILLEVDDAQIVGDTLYVSAYVTDEQHKYLSNPARKVSIRAADKWRDGDGKEYGTCLLHVAVVDQPIMSGQQPFRELANGGTGMDPIIEGVNALLKAMGKDPLPDTVTLDNLGDVLTGMAAALGTATETETDSSDSDVPVIDTTEDADPAMAEMSATIKQLSSRLEKFEARDGQSAFDAKCAELGKAGVPAKAIEKAKLAGKSLKWDLSILSPLEDFKTIDMSRKGKADANGDAPVIPSDNPERKKRTPEEIKEDAKSFR